MIVFINGQFVPEEEQAVVSSALDRGFLYGDGLYETVADLQWQAVSLGGAYGTLRIAGRDFLKYRFR